MGDLNSPVGLIVALTKNNKGVWSGVTNLFEEFCIGGGEMNREFPVLVSHAYDSHRNRDTSNCQCDYGRLQSREGKIREVSNEF